MVPHGVPWCSAIEMLPSSTLTRGLLDGTEEHFDPLQLSIADWSHWSLAPIKPLSFKSVHVLKRTPFPIPKSSMPHLETLVLLSIHLGFFLS